MPIITESNKGDCLLFMNKKVTKKVTRKPVKSLKELLKKESLAHYKRMITWVKTQPETDKPREYIMDASIKETWHGDNCAYCSRYSSYSKCTNQRLFPNFPDGTVDACPLRPKEDLFDGDTESDNESLYCCGGLWQEMHSSKTWKTWLSYARKIVNYIKRNG